MNEPPDEYFIPGNLYYQFCTTNPGAVIIRTWLYVGIVERSCSFESCHGTRGHQFQLITEEDDIDAAGVYQFAEETLEPFLDLDDIVKSILAWRAQADTTGSPQEQIRRNMNRPISAAAHAALTEMMHHSPTSSGVLKQYVVRDVTALAGLESVSEKVDLLLSFCPSAAEMHLISQNRLVEGIQFLSDFKSTETVSALSSSPHFKKLSICYMNQVPTGFYDGIASLSSLEFLELNSPLVDDAFNECLQSLPHLLSLKLNHTNVTADIGLGLQACPHLLELDLEHTQVSDRLFQSDFNCQKLDSLNLDFTHITENSLQTIKKLKQLRSLSLRGTDLADGCLPALQEMAQLTSLCLSETKISVSGLSELIHSLENCTVYY